MDDKMKLVALVSGGMDSAVLVSHLLELGNEVRAVGVDYGQRHRRELEAAKVVCSQAGVSLEIIPLGRVFGESALTGETPVPDGHYTDESMRVTVVPNRNMVLLSIAVSRCISWGFDGVAYGAHAGDHTVYHDCRIGFYDALKVAITQCDASAPVLLSPFVSWTKGEIALRGIRLGVSLAETWSCYKGGETQCGVCGTCVERIEALEWAGSQ